MMRRMKRREEKEEEGKKGEGKGRKGKGKGKEKESVKNREAQHFIYHLDILSNDEFRGFFFFPLLITYIIYYGVKIKVSFLHINSS